LRILLRIHSGFRPRIDRHTHKNGSKLQRYRQQRRPKRPCRHDGHGPMSFGDAVNSLPVVLLRVRQRSQDRCEDHPRAMDPRHGFMKANRPAGSCSRHARRADRKVCGCKVQVRRSGTQNHVHCSVRIARVPAARIDGRGTDAIIGSVVIRPTVGGFSACVSVFPAAPVPWDFL
jgi:hypothetical protein